MAVTKQTNPQQKINPHKDHRKRVKAMYKAKGIDGMPKHTVLEMLLFFGIPYKDTNEIAHELINRYGSLSAALEADVESLKNVKNMTENAAILMHLVADISRLYRIDKTVEEDKVGIGNGLEEYLTLKYSGVADETLFLIMFNKNGCLTNLIPLWVGNHSSTHISAERIVKLATSYNVTSIALAHNHPDNSGVSSDDIVSFRRMVFQLRSVGINLVESYVITHDKVIGINEMTRRSKLNYNNTKGEEL